MAKYFNSTMARHFNVYVECPTTGKTIEAMRGDDKAICNCKAAAEKGGTHVVALCKSSTVERWMQEHGYTDRAGA